MLHGPLKNLHLAHFEYLMHSNPTLTVWWKPLFEHFHPPLSARIYHGSFCLASFRASFRVATVPSLIIISTWNTHQLCMRRLFESLKGLEGHPASSHNSFSYANSRAQYRPLRVWVWAGRLRSPPLSFNDYCGGFLTVCL